MKLHKTNLTDEKKQKIYQDFCQRKKKQGFHKSNETLFKEIAKEIGYHWDTIKRIVYQNMEKENR